MTLSSSIKFLQSFDLKIKPNVLIRISSLLGIWMLFFGVLIIVKPEILAFLFAGFFFFSGILALLFACYYKKNILDS